MNRTERVKAAKERLREAKAIEHNHAEDRRGRDASAAKAEATIARLRKRGGMALYKVTQAAPPVHSTEGVAGFSLAGYSEGPKDEKGIREALLGGSVKLSMPGGAGVSIAPSTAVMRTRFPSPLNARAILRAQAALDRATARMLAAKKALADEVASAFDAAPKPDPKPFFTQIAMAIAAKKAIPYRGSIDNDRWAIERDLENVKQAEQHLAATRSGAECSCHDCQIKANRAAEAVKEGERRATLPLQTVACPTHGRKRLHIEPERLFTGNVRGVEWPEDMQNRWLDLPIAYCVGHEIVLAGQAIAEREKARAAAEKAAAKLAKAGPRKARIAKSAPGEVVEGDTITFICPNCGAEQASEVVLVEPDDEDLDGNPLPGELRVGCNRCEAEPLASAVVVKQKEAKAA